MVLGVWWGRRVGKVNPSRQDSCAAAPGPVGQASNPSKETTMQWQPPTACDFRFGFEITMYIAAR